MTNILYEDNKYTVLEDDEENVSVVNKETEMCLHVQYGDNIEFKSSIDAGLNIKYVLRDLLRYGDSDWF